jgi:hypothetical protein
MDLDGTCDYVYRMQSTIDHTNVSELARLLGAKLEGSKGGVITKECS